MTPSVNGSPINARPDWSHQWVGGPVAGRREIVFPGLDRRFVQRGAKLPSDLMLFGAIEGAGGDLAAAKTALRSAQAAIEAWMADYQTRTVTIDGEAFADMELVEVVAGQDMTGVRAASGFKVARPIRLRFRQLASGGGA